MSANGALVGWIAFGAAIVQTVASVIQVFLGSRQGSDDERRTVAKPVIAGFVALVLELIGWLVSRTMHFQATELHPADSTHLSPVLLASLPFVPALYYGLKAALSCLTTMSRTRRLVEIPPDEAHAYSRQEYEQTGHTWADVLSLLMGALVGVAVVFTCLHFASVIDLDQILG